MAFDIALPTRPTGASDTARDLYDAVLADHQRFIGDPVRRLRAATADSPAFVMAQVFLGYLHAAGTDAATLPAARAYHAAAAALPANDREAGHVAALGAMVEGRFAEAAALLAKVSEQYPRDALALQIGQLLDFLTGDAVMLRDRIGRVRPHWTADMPGYHAVLGLHAFGLEETGDYAAAEAAGRAAIDLEPRNSWAQHAVAHVLEMQDRREEGIAWMRQDVDRWTVDSYFAVHNWWHLALFHWGLGDAAGALELLDGPIWGDRSALAYDMVDASALLWRLHLDGVEVGDRWTPLADSWTTVVGESTYAFNDAHAAMAFAAAGRRDALTGLREAQDRAMASPGDNADMVRLVGRPLVDGIAAYADGDWRGAIAALERTRGVDNRFGGSHAQRDVIDLTLIAAAERAGDAAAAARFRAERAGKR
jgi:tetratricopeptide (TPR) repeat protein